MRIFRANSVSGTDILQVPILPSQCAKRQTTWRLATKGLVRSEPIMTSRSNCAAQFILPDRGSMSHLPILSAFKRAPSLDVSKWYMGSLITNLAEAGETNAAYCLMEALLKPGNEPPPHVHSREDELFYVIEGNFDVYVGAELFTVSQGGCVQRDHLFDRRPGRGRATTEGAWRPHPRAR
jgi:mannose-6-phosphate isomerase-like protein (cupin superfamily)